MAIGAGGVEILGFDQGEAEEDWAVPSQDRPPTGVRAYLPADDLLGERLQLLRARLADAAAEWPDTRTEIHIRPAAETDWEAAWKEHYHTVRIGRVAVVPSWEEYSPESGEAVVRMDPGLAFGAGSHPTTRQSLLLLQELLAPGQSVLDIGTGSGILAAAAARLGAGRVLARDIDPQAVEVARDNIARNGLAALVTVERGDLLTGLTGRHDLILANLIADLHLRLLPALPARLAPAGRAVFAGIIASRADELRDAAAAAGLWVLKESRDGEWVALVTAHGPNPV